MPKLARPKAGLLARALFWVVLIGLGCWAFATHPGWTSAGLSFLVVSLVLDSSLQRRRLRALAAQRCGESICDFARSFDARAVDTWVIRAVYEALQDYMASPYPNFPVRASDRLLKTIVADPDDLDMVLVPEIAERTGRSLEHVKLNQHFGKVVTVSDLVLFMNAQTVLPTSTDHDRALAAS